eukprot:7707635-Pyramimonas_sp.AAC.1
MSGPDLPSKGGRYTRPIRSVRNNCDFVRAPIGDTLHVGRKSVGTQVFKLRTAPLSKRSDKS